MFERFTQEARAVVTGAVEQAGRSGDGWVDTEHLLLGLAGGDSIAAGILARLGATPETLTAVLWHSDDARLLETLGIDIDEVRASVERVFGPGALAGAGSDRPPRRGLRKGPHIPFTADAKKALELSLREAIALQSGRIEAGHILLGLLRTGGRAAEAVDALGIDRDALRRAVVEAVRRAS